MLHAQRKRKGLPGLLDFIRISLDRNERMQSQKCREDRAQNFLNFFLAEKKKKIQKDYRGFKASCQHLSHILAPVTGHSRGSLKLHAPPSPDVGTASPPRTAAACVCGTYQHSMDTKEEPTASSGYSCSPRGAFSYHGQVHP